MAVQEQLKSSAIEVILHSWSFQQRKDFGGLGEAESSGLPPGPAPKGAGSPLGTWLCPYASCLGTRSRRRARKKPSAAWLRNNRAAKAERRSAPPRDSAPPGFSFFGRPNSQARRTRGAPRAPCGAGTRATLPSCPRSGRQPHASLKESA